MKQCVSELCVGDYCDSAHRCLLEDGHEGPHEFVGWLSNGVQDGWDEAEIVVRVESGEGSAAGEGVGTQASPPPPGSYEQAKAAHTLEAERMIRGKS